MYFFYFGTKHFILSCCSVPVKYGFIECSNTRDRLYVLSMCILIKLENVIILLKPTCMASFTLEIQVFGIYTYIIYCKVKIHRINFIKLHMSSVSLTSKTYNCSMKSKRVSLFLITAVIQF